MADLSKIKLGNTEYNIKDAVARAAISDIPEWALSSSKPTYTASEVGATTTSEVNSLIATAIGNINSFDVAIVNSLPTTNIKEHTIYFMSNSNSGNNVYDEYMYINSNWELIGSTQIDLSNYVTAKNGSGTLNTDFVGTLINSENNELSLQYIDDVQQKSSGILINSTGTDIAGMEGMPLTIRGLSSPINNGDATNKQYVDNAIAAIEIPAAELDTNVESMLDGFNLDYTSNSINLNAAGVICKEITITDSGVVSQTLNAGCIYHFTGDLTELTITLNPASGLAYYNFDFTTGSNIPVINLPNTVIMQDDYTISANKHYEISILNNYGAVAIWTN